MEVTFSFLPESATCDAESCLRGRNLQRNLLSGLNFSQLLQGDQEVASESAIFSSFEYPHMSSVQDAGKHFIGSEGNAGTWSFSPSS